MICFFVLAVIFACVPAAPQPVPTLDPGDINRFIQQTAEAASMQTLAAVPTFTSTSTLTVTPKATFTPEATETPFATFILATPTSTLRGMFYRVKHDNQLEIYGYKSRTAGAEWSGHEETPEIVVLFAAPKRTSGTQRTTINSAWEDYMDALNSFNKDKLRYLKADDTALFNSAGFPHLESLTMGGNVITLDKIQGEWAQVHTMDYNTVGSVEVENYITRPDLVHKFVIVGWNRKSDSTYWLSPPPGAVYWPLVSSHTLWIPMDRIEPFPTLPLLVTATKEQDIRREPNVDSDLTGKKLSEGESVTIYQYYPSGSKVWARLIDGSWIALFMYQQGRPTHFTSWKMETLPPP